MILFMVNGIKKDYLANSFAKVVFFIVKLLPRVEFYLLPLELWLPPELWPPPELWLLLELDPRLLLELEPRLELDEELLDGLL